MARVEGWASGDGVNHLLGPMPEVKVLERDPKYITTITQLRQIEQVMVEWLLPDSGEAGQGAAPPQLRAPQGEPRRLDGPEAVDEAA